MRKEKTEDRSQETEGRARWRVNLLLLCALCVLCGSPLSASWPPLPPLPPAPRPADAEPEWISVPLARPEAADTPQNDPLRHLGRQDRWAGMGPHEDSHGIHGQLRAAAPPRHNAVYVLGGRAAIVREPAVRLSEVARAVPAGARGGGYRLYLLRAQAWWDDRSLYVLDEQASYLNGLETNWNVAASRERAAEFGRYVDVLLDLVRRRDPQYDRRQLERVAEYQRRRTERLLKAVPPAATAASMPGDSVHRPRGGEVAGTAPDALEWLSEYSGLVVWTTEGCSPCRAMRPDVDRLAHEGAAVVVLDLVGHSQIAKAVHVARAPTTLAYRDGRELRRVAGQLSDAALRQLLSLTAGGS